MPAYHILCPECSSDQVEVCTPPMITGVDSEGGYYEIDPPSSWVCMNQKCGAYGPDVEADCVVSEEVAQRLEAA